jgi:methanethiol S-methyltransferase
MRRLAVLLYGVVCYAFFLGVFVYAALFVGGLGVPTTLDGPRHTPLGQGLAINTLLIVGFALQHSVMARPAFKRWIGRWVAAPVERSTYVLCSSVALALLFWQWRPLGGVIWDVHQPLLRGTLWALFASGWLIVLITTFLINHFDLFGLRQTWLHFRGRPYTPLPMTTPGPYRIVRHPLYVGWLVAFWATPTMTLAHLVFALGMTVYILAAIPLEERDLASAHRGYDEYRRRVPMLIPRLRRGLNHTPAAELAPAAVACSQDATPTSDHASVAPVR